jgi:hypothetical protein
MRQARILSVAGVTLLVSSGCVTTTTPEPVLQLAERTGANAGILSVELAKAARDSREVTEARAATIARLHGVNTELRAHYDFDVLLTRRSGQGADLETIKTLEEWHKQADALFKGVGEAASARKAEIVGKALALDTKSEALKSVAGRLARLAEADKPEDRARFLAGFIKQVRDDVQTQLDKSDTSAQRAKALLQNVEDKLNETKTK